MSTEVVKDDVLLSVVAVKPSGFGLGDNIVLVRVASSEFSGEGGLASPGRADEQGDLRLRARRRVELLDLLVEPRVSGDDPGMRFYQVAFALPRADKGNELGEVSSLALSRFVTKLYVGRPRDPGPLLLAVGNGPRDSPACPQ